MAIPFELKGLDHVVLRVTDLNQSLAFYCDVLGCTLEREVPDLGLYQLRAGDHLIDLVVVGSKLGGDIAPDQTSANQDHFCLNISVDSQEAEGVILNYLATRNLESLGSGERYGAEGFGWSVYLADPDGNQVELKVSTQA